MTTSNDFEMFSGDTKLLQLTAILNGGPVNLSRVVLMTFAIAPLRSNGKFSRTPVLVKELSEGVQITDEAAGEFEVTLDSADTATLSGKFHYEIQVTDGWGNVSTLNIGTLTIRKDLITT